MSASPLRARALPPSRAPVEMVVVPPAAPVSTSPPAVEKLAAVIGSKKGRGEPVVAVGQKIHIVAKTATTKPCKNNLVLCLQSF